MQLPDSGFKAIVDGLTGKQSAQPMLGHTFVGYRRKAFDDFVAVFKLPANPHEQTHDKYTCEQVVKNAKPGSESHEAAKKALKHWPSA
jgi:hypothetical protein